MADQTMGPALHLLVWNSVYITAGFRRTNFRVTPDLLFYWLWLHEGFLMQRSHRSVSLPKGNSGQTGWYTSTMIKRMLWCAAWLQDQTLKKKNLGLIFSKGSYDGRMQIKTKIKSTFLIETSLVLTYAIIQMSEVRNEYFHSAKFKLNIKILYLLNYKKNKIYIYFFI